MGKATLLTTGLVLAVLAAGWAAPTENPYDVLGRVFRPFFNVLLSGGRDPEKAMVLEMKIVAVEGRLPTEFAGATIRAAVESPDKVRMEAPVFGETFTVCRVGNEVWATPGSKVEFLLGKFKNQPPYSPKTGTPLTIPVSSQQAIFLVALFDIENPREAEVDVIHGEEMRVLSGGLMPEIARAAKADDFGASLFIDGTYRPRRIEIRRKDFQTAVDITRLEFSTSLPASTWQPPAGTTDIYRTTAGALEQVLYVVINSLQSKESDMPWTKER